ncbi:MAG TPA: hypothetical protein VKM37_03430 [Balneolaceae bacterium]|nr:hypothetical protein [Balneolaceae bacterium]
MNNKDGIPIPRFNSFLNKPVYGQRWLDRFMDQSNKTLKASQIKARGDVFSSETSFRV